VEAFETFLRSHTFWSEVVLRFGICLVLIFAITFLFLKLARNYKRRRLSVRSFTQDESGGGHMIEFVLMTPIILIFFLVLGQMTILTRTAMIVHYSAYSAARSARVHMPVYTGLAAKVGFEGFASLDATLSPRPDSADYHAIAEMAARRVLIAASPTNKTLSCTSSCNVPSYFEAIDFAGKLGDGALEAAMNTRARYAFDDRNMSLDLVFGEVDSFNFDALTGSDIALKGKNDEKDISYPVTASVSFRAHLMAPYFANTCSSGGRCLFGVRRDGSRYFAPIAAQVTVY